MKQTGRVNALLVELLIVVLFFMLASTILMEIFGVARQNSTRAGLRSDALMQAQNVAETLYAAPDAAGKLQEMGYAAQDGRWVLDCGGYTLQVSCTEQETEAGMLRELQVSALLQDAELFSLPAGRYFPGEVSP